MKRLIPLLLCIGLISTPSLAREPGDRGIHFVKIVFDPPGDEGASNKGLKEEYLRITNDGKARNLEGWMIRNLAGDTYVIDEEAHFPKGSDLYLRTGKGEDGTSICIDYCGNNSGPTYFRYWDRDEEAWDNDRDKAILITKNGRVVDSCGYGRQARSPKRC